MIIYDKVVKKVKLLLRVFNFTYFFFQLSFLTKERDFYPSSIAKMIS